MLDQTMSVIVHVMVDWMWDLMVSCHCSYPVGCHSAMSSSSHGRLDVGCQGVMSLFMLGRTASCFCSCHDGALNYALSCLCSCRDGALNYAVSCLCSCRSGLDIGSRRVMSRGNP